MCRYIKDDDWCCVFVFFTCIYAPFKENILIINWGIQFIQVKFIQVKWPIDRNLVEANSAVFVQVGNMKLWLVRSAVTWPTLRGDRVETKERWRGGQLYPQPYPTPAPYPNTHVQRIPRSGSSDISETDQILIRNLKLYYNICILTQDNDSFMSLLMYLFFIRLIVRSYIHLFIS